MIDKKAHFGGLFIASIANISYLQEDNFNDLEKTMLLSSLESVPGHTISRQLDVVYGSTVRSKHVGRDLMAGLKISSVVN